METPMKLNGNETPSILRMDHESRTPPPKVLHLLSLVLEKSIKKNEALSSTKKDGGGGGGVGAATIFHGSSAPVSLSIRQYVERIFKYSCCSPCCFILAYIYIDRFLQRMNHVCLTSLNVHRLLITSVMVAAKFIDEGCKNNAYYAKIGGVSTMEMNKLEMEFLFNLDFRLHVTPQIFAKYCMQLEKEDTSGTYQIEQPNHVIGIKGGLQNKIESKPTTKIAPHFCKTL